jgi:hypothetical protein
MKIIKNARKLLLIFLLGIIVIPVGYGQAAIIVLILGDKVATEQFHLSIDGAINISNLPGLDVGKTCGGVNFGLGTHIKLGEKWHLKPEFKPLSRKGARSVNAITSVPGEVAADETKLKLNYLDIPVLLQYNITPRFFVSAGPQVSFLTGVNQISFGTISDGKETSIKIDAKSFFNKTNFSFPVEAGYTLSLATKRSTTKMDINVFARYEYDFVEVFKDPAVGSSKISLFQIGLSLPFIKSAEELAKPK